MITISEMTDILPPGHSRDIRGCVDAADGSADKAKSMPQTRAAVQPSQVLRLFPAFICAQALLIAALLLLNYLNSIG